MKTYKLKQEVISRATRKNEILSVPRKIEMVTLTNQFDANDRVIELSYEDQFIVLDPVEFKSWEPLINELYEEVTDNG